MSQTKTDKPRGSIVADQELAIMNRVAKLLNTLDEDERTRAMAWLLTKYIPGKFRLAMEQTPETPK